MARDTQPAYDDFLDEAAGAAVSSHDIILIHRGADHKLQMRVCGLNDKDAKWNAVAMLEWAKWEILSDQCSDKKLS